VPLQQINLKVTPEVAEAWRAAAAAAGHRSIRDWLVAITTAGPGPAAADPGLEERVVRLESLVESLVARSGDGPSPDRVMSAAPSTEARPDGAMVSVELAKLLGITSSALNGFATSYGPGAVHRSGWKVIGKVSAPSGIARWLWSPPEAG
jgi:hypothetical protein